MGRREGVLPVTLGFYDFDFDELLDFDFNEQFGTASFLPGVEVDIPVLSNWMLIPNAHLGVGTEVQGEDYATIYSLGTKSRLRFPTDNAEFMLGNAFTFAGYAARDGVDDSLSRFVSGLTKPCQSYPTLCGCVKDMSLTEERADKVRKFLQ